jgi:hypothetical protein
MTLVLLVQVVQDISTNGSHLMRSAFLTFAALAALSQTGNAQIGGKPSCPADPIAASFRIWPAGQLYNRGGIVGTHPCGQKMRCDGGDQMQNKQRRCTWL